MFQILKVQDKAYFHLFLITVAIMMSGCASAPTTPTHHKGQETVPEGIDGTKISIRHSKR